MKHFAYLDNIVGLIRFTFEDEILTGVSLVEDNKLIDISEVKYEKIARDILVMDAEKKKDYLDFSSLSQFQKSVLIALLNVPVGTTITYKELAKEAGHPTAIRAVAHAVAMNPMPIVIPCHRVVRGDSTGQFVWGSDVKEALLQSEGAV